MISFLFFNNLSKASSKFLNIRILFLLSIVILASFSSNLVFAQHDHGDHGSSSSGSESGGAGSFVGLEGYQAMVELSEIGNCYGCNNNTNNQVLTIFKHGTADMPFLAGGTMFMISPNPYAFTNFNSSANPQFFGPTLIVSDNDPLDYDPTPGVIELIKVNPGVYSVWELRGPQGFIKNNAPHSSAEVAIGNYPSVPVTNLFLNSSSGPQTMLPPPLPTSNLNTMNTYAPKVGNQALTQLPSSIVSSKSTVLSTPAPSPIVFGTVLPANAVNWTSTQRFSNLGIPTYDAPPSGDSNSGYIPPVFSANNTDGSRIISTPKFSSIDFNTNLVLRLDGVTQHNDDHGTHGPSVLGINLPLAVAGSDFGVSLRINKNPPSTFPNLDPANGFEALFIDLSAVGDIDLSNSNSFSENPTITFYLDKNSGSCVNPSTVTVYLLNGNQWNSVQVSGHAHPPTLVPSLHTSTQCAYEQEVEHFSSYLVGTGTESSHDHGSSHGSSHSHAAGAEGHAGHGGLVSYTINDCTVNGLIRDIYNNQVYLQIHTDSDGDITTNSGPGDFYTPGEARGQLNYQYGSKVFSTLAKSTNEVLDTEQDSILWAKSRATATASFESTSFNEIQYTISTKNLPNIVGISLYLGDQYTNSEIRLIDIPYTVNPFKPNSDTITGKLTNDDMCKISHEEHGFASHDGHTMTDETIHDDHTMDEEGIISHDDHVMDQVTTKEGIISDDQHSSHNESNTCYGVSCVDPEPKEFLVALVDGSFDSSYDFGNISGKKILASTHYKTFPITYDLNGELKKMTVNEEENTLSLYFDNVIEDKLTLRLPRALVDAENNNFLVMVTASPEKMIDYEIISSDESFFTIQLDVPSNTSQVSIIGTRVIPEFGTMVMMILTVSIISIIAVTRKTKIFV